MGTTRPNGIWKPGPSEPVELHVLATVVATSASNALGGLGQGARQPRSWYAANQAAKDALVGPETGDRVFLADTSWWETLTEQGWKITRTLRAIPFTPTFIGMDFGNATTYFTYSINDDRVFVQGTLLMGTTTIPYSEGVISMSLPVTAVWGDQEEGVLGTATIPGEVGGYTAPYRGVVAGTNGGQTGQISLRFAFKSGLSSGGLLGNMNGTYPRAMGTSTSVRELSVAFSYLRA